MTERRQARMTLRWAALALVLLAAGCAAGPAGRTPAGAAGPAVVPAPASLKARPGSFVVGARTKIVFPEDQAGLVPVTAYLKDLLDRPTGLDIAVEARPVSSTAAPAGAGSILLRLDDISARVGAEGYLLDVAPDGIEIRGAAPAGLFYGVQTLRQLLPAVVEEPSVAGTPGPAALTVPCVTIEDRPRFAWRGAMLDCSRHFFPKEFVLRWIDILAAHKLNTFHWHLTDDQGWRIEIKKYPRLTGVGAWRVDREDQHWNAREPQQPGEAATYGGFYTQDDVREVVAYAASRCVTVVPEIEMPGHAMGALAGYPGLSCTGGPFTVKPGGYWPITDVFCPGNDETFAFLEDVLAEVAGLFPGPFIHIGGDEVDKTEWRRCPKCQARMKAEGLKDEQELQSYFTRRIERFLEGLGKRLLGWDEILEGGIAPRATVMSWRGTEGGIAAARAGHDVVMSPTSHCYIDYYQGDPAVEPPGIGGYVPLSKIYAFEPVPEVLTAAEAGHILGGQANLWTEYVSDNRHAEYMALPRLAALAEVVWSPRELRDWPGFAARIGGLLPRYAKAGLNYSRSAWLVNVKTASRDAGRRVELTLSTEIPGLDIRYTTDGTEPGPGSKRYRKPIVLKRTGRVRAAAFLGAERMSPAVASESFTAHAALGRQPVLAFPFSPRYAAGGQAGLVDGLLGSLNAGDGRWQGFEGTDLDAVIDLGKPRTVRGVAVRCLQNINSWIFLPASVELSVSTDGRSYETVGRVGNDLSPRLGQAVIKEFGVGFAARSARFVRVFARSIGAVPDWHYGAGGKSWIFADEIVVE
ncbi:MAG TPA: family 20 glycosylhydrolase [Candidatus Aminicenantes bacterium]|nr:family 20 glycosylhydrolase [Candidatus Aminicenantes bacterium]HRY65443.1 family 20 glycosylhydrolase [Candidatus Aminicenantes bacterium]HRZ72089.1 family 20 glycosylhydrolase [Candidatus Aminicenantes bacterium]